MGPVDVRVGHDDDAMVAELFKIKFLLTNSAAQSSDKCTHFSR